MDPSDGRATKGKGGRNLIAPVLDSQSPKEVKKYCFGLK
jgi:hypothetical protein